MPARASAAAPALSIRDVAERLSVNNRTIYRLAQAGALPGFKVAGTWRFLKSDLDAWIEQRKAEARRPTSRRAARPKRRRGRA
jgi:excisionase family DNA binding protein